MKKSLFCFFLTLTVHTLLAQPYGNEWIKNNQKYFRIPIGKSGIYRIDYTALIPAATDMKLDLANVNPKKWQMFYKGKEIPIYVAGENDNIFNSYDYIEFYARLNDAELDKELYNKPEFLPDEQYSMFGDSSYYFLTFLPSGSPQTAWHMQNYRNTNYAGFTVQPWFLHESSTRFSDRYNPGKPFAIQTENSENPEYVNGEGFGSIPFGSGTGYNAFTVAVETRFPSSSGPQPEYSFSSVSINEHKIINPDHRFKLGISADNFTYQYVLDTSFDGYQMIKKSAAFDKANLSNNNTYFKFDVQFIGGVINQFHSVNYVRVNYARNFDLDGKSQFMFNLAGDNNPKHIEWNNYNFNRQFPLVYDLSNGYRMRADKLSPTVIRLITPASSKNKTEYFLCDSSEITHLTALNIQSAISFESLENPLMEYDPTVTVNKNRLLLITHPKFIGEASSRYLNFRGSSTYANPCSLVGIQQLYNHFSYGMPHPIAISRFLEYLKDNGDTTLKFVFLVGRGYQSNLIRSWGKYNDNIIPSIGVPASDNLFATQMTDSNLVPAVAIGRLTIDNASQFSFYVDKLMEHEASANEFWKKSVLHLAGGDNGNQAAYIKDRLDNAGAMVEGSPFGGSTVTFTKSSVGISEPYLKQKSIDNINAGMQLVTFLGHGSAAVTDVDIGDTIEYFNERKYPVFYFNGCKIGNPCLGPPDKNIKLSGESFIKARNRGAVAFIAQTGLSELNSVDRQIQQFYSLVFHDKYTGNYTVGEAINDLLRTTGVYGNELNRIQSRILFLQGDPSIRWYQPTLPDYSITAKSMFLYPSDLTAVSDSFAVAVVIENKGRFKEDSINIKIERTYPNNFLVTEHLFRRKPVGYRDTVYL